MEKNMLFSTIRMDHNKENAKLHIYVFSEKDEHLVAWEPKTLQPD